MIAEFAGLLLMGLSVLCRQIGVLIVRLWYVTCYYILFSLLLRDILWGVIV